MLLEMLLEARHKWNSEGLDQLIMSIQCRQDAEESLYRLRGLFTTDQYIKLLQLIYLYK